MRLILIRHGDPDYANDNLTEKGKREAELLSDRVKTWDVTKFYSSPLGRAKATAEPTMKKTGRSYEVLPWSQEFFHLVYGGDGDRIPWDFYPSEWAENEMNFNKNEWVNTPIMQSGDIDMYYSEVCESLDALLSEYGLKRTGNYYTVKERLNATVVIFCHYGFSMIALSHLLNISAQALLHGMFMPTASITVLNTEERYKDEAYFRCQCVGDTRHLYAGNEEISQSGYFAPIFQG